jgi:hypothetical protein
MKETKKFIITKNEILKLDKNGLTKMSIELLTKYPNDLMMDLLYNAPMCIIYDETYEENNKGINLDEITYIK